MSNGPTPKTAHELGTQRHVDQPIIYQIQIEGHLDPQWATWFGEMTITLQENGKTLLTGFVVDQAALHRLLRKIRDIGAPLVSVVRLDATQPDGSGDGKQ